LTIYQFLDDEVYSQQLVERMSTVESLKFHFTNDEPTVTCFLECLKDFKDQELALRRFEVFGGRSMQYTYDQSQVCFVLERSTSCPNLREIEFSNQLVSDFEPFLTRILKSNMKRKPENRLTHLGFRDIDIHIQLENDVIYIKMVLPDILKQFGKGLKSFTLLRKDKL
jgi:hypothetical protein